jgi:hypothetical protein
MTSLKALDVAVRRLRKSRLPSVRAAVAALVELKQELGARAESERDVRIVPFRSELPNAACRAVVRQSSPAS